MKHHSAPHLALAALLSAGVGLPAQAERAIFAGGCFWCVESDFQDLPGVSAAVSGYTGGTLENPDYQSVSGGDTGHYEAVEITFDPALISYRELLDIYWTTIDPLDRGGQFCDRGTSYLSAVFVLDEAQRADAEASKAAAQQRLGAEQPIVTPILPAATFYRAEDYHQDYYRKKPLRYKYYRWGCERDQRLEELWGPQGD